MKSAEVALSIHAHLITGTVDREERNYIDRANYRKKLGEKNSNQFVLIVIQIDRGKFDRL